MQSDPQKDCERDKNTKNVKNTNKHNNRVTRLQIFNPKINAGASISESTMDELSFVVGLNTNR